VARSLKAINIRIVPNMVGRDTVAVEVPNAAKEKVRLKELMSKSETFARMKLPMFLGKDASGEPLIADLTQMPHMLIAGTTGSGKSVCMNTIIMSFLYTKKPSELKLVLVDPKMVEMSQFRDIPHLMCPVVTEMAKAAAILEWAMRKMDERYELLAEAGCRDIAAYNDLPWEELRERFNPQTPEEEARIPRRLPYMVFIIDELADLMMTTKEVEGSIIRLAQKARAVGIHLILATQRPQANVVTGLIKSNMPARIAFKVASGMDSRIVLDQKGGELLLGQGDMLYLSPRTSKLIRAQGTLVDDPEIRRVVRFMRDVAKPSFEHQLLQLRKSDSDEERILESKNNSSASLAAAQEDPMFFRAVEIVLETKRGSVSLLQRRLAIGYTRASRLIDLMGIAGIISDHKGSVARDVLITMEEWEAMKGQAEADLAAIAAAGGGQQGQLFEGAAAPADGAAEEQTEEEELLEEYEEDEEEGPLDEADEEYEDEEYEEEDESEQERERAPF
jgi:DNA segregation ATPase FtsK/SpoIIIE, S-DNA-T family